MWSNIKRASLVRNLIVTSAQLQMVPRVDWSPLVYGTHRELVGSSSMCTECLLSNRNFRGVYLWNKHKHTPGIVWGSVVFKMFHVWLCQSHEDISQVFKIMPKNQWFGKTRFFSKNLIFFWNSPKTRFLNFHPKKSRYKTQQVYIYIHDECRITIESLSQNIDDEQQYCFLLGELFDFQRDNVQSLDSSQAVRPCRRPGICWLSMGSMMRSIWRCLVLVKRR